MARYKHRIHEVVMNVRDDKPMGAVWEPIDEAKKAPAKKAAARKATK